MAKLVFCEDEALIQKMIRVMLRETGHQIYFASDGLAGLALIERERPDVVFSDVWMPLMTGLELCDALRARAPLAYIPSVLITASVQREELAAGFRHGATAILKKPFSPAELRAAVARYTHPPRAEEQKNEARLWLSESRGAKRSSRRDPAGCRSGQLPGWYRCQHG